MDIERVVIVGAGLAGLTCARELAALGIAPIVLDKGRRVGGRSCSRVHADGRAFDHGAQFFTARDPWTEARVAEWSREGALARWQPRRARASHEAWWVGTPHMGSLAQHLARDLDVRTSQHVTAARQTARGWQIECDQGALDATALVVAIPAPQACALLGPLAPACDFDSCWAAMVSLVEGQSEFDVLEPADGPFSWAAREASKPGRRTQPGEEAWTVHASAEWSAEHLDADPAAIAELLSTALRQALGRESALSAVAHRWRYAKPRVATPLGCHAEATLVVCGDWMQSPRIEGALLSGRLAAQKLATQA